jgi:hypothetical protein
MSLRSISRVSVSRLSVSKMSAISPCISRTWSRTSVIFAKAFCASLASRATFSMSALAGGRQRPYQMKRVLWLGLCRCGRTAVCGSTSISWGTCLHSLSWGHSLNRSSEACKRRNSFHSTNRQIKIVRRCESGTYSCQRCELVINACFSQRV